MTAEEKQAFSQKMIEKYDGEAHPFFCGSRLLTDRVLKFSEISRLAWHGLRGKPDRAHRRAGLRQRAILNLPHPSR